MALRKFALTTAAAMLAAAGTVSAAESTTLGIQTHYAPETPSGKLARAEAAALLNAALANIPVDDQIAIELAYWEELSGAEIAAVLEIPEPTARSRLVRARAKLRRALEQMAGPADADDAERALDDK